MAVDGIEETNRKLKAAMERIGGPMTERFVTEMLIAAGARAATYTPVATSALINSQYRKTWQAQKSWIGELGYGPAPAGGEYTQRRGGTHDPKAAGGYAHFVHDAKGTLMGTNTPRSPARLGYIWGPHGEPKFLEKGVQEMVKDDLAGIIRRAYK